MYIGKNRVIIKTQLNTKLFLDTEDLSLTPHLITDKVWEVFVTKFIQNQIKFNMNVVEVGSNIGYYSTILAGMVGQNGHVWCFEPNPHAFDLLKKNIEINGYRKRVTLTNRIVTDTKDKLKSFNILDNHKISSSCMDVEDMKKIEGGLYENEFMSSIPLLTTTIDSIVPEGTKIDFMKIDAEGCEHGVILGAKRVMDENPHVKILMEMCPDYIKKAGGNPEELLDLLLNQGYKMFDVNHATNIIPVSKSVVLNSNYTEVFFTK